MLDGYPHLAFRRAWDTAELDYALGQCEAIVYAISEVPITPQLHRQLLQVSLRKGAQATAAIEGNTLSDEEVDAVADGQELPPSKHYQAKEVENVINAMNALQQELAIDEQALLICPELIKRLHKMVCEDLGEHINAIPGQFASRPRVVGRYKCPDHLEVPRLIDQLCDWMKMEFGYASGRQSFKEAVIQAIVAHVYLEWIHPFDDGNGRTGRLLEFYLLMRAGLPNIASHIMSNHYNDTRPEYYRHLEHASQTRSLSAFLKYAMQGFIDGLYATLDKLQAQQLQIAWREYIYEKFGKVKYTKTNVFKRRRDAILNFPPDKEIALSEIPDQNVKLARLYSGLSERTLNRDIQELVELDLIQETRPGIFRARRDLMQQHMPAARRRVGSRREPT